MNRNMVDYMHELSNDSYDGMIEILEFKFKKFRRLFNMLSQFSKDIMDIYQDDTEHHVMDVTTTFKSAKIAKSAYGQISNLKCLDESIQISLDKSKINIILMEVEAEEPQPLNDNERSE